MSATYGKPFRRLVRGQRSSTWSVYVYERGRRWRRSTHQTSYRAALAAVDQWRRQELAGGYPVEFVAAVDAWLASKAPRVSRSYLQVYRSYRNQWAREWPRALLAEVDAGALDRYLRLRRSRGKSARTVNGERAALRMFFGWAQDQGWVARNPARLVSPYPERRRNPRALDPDQEAALLAAAQEEGGQVYGFLLVMLHSGLRRGTVAQLEWDDVDLKRREWRIAAQKMKSREEFRGRPLSEALYGYLAGLERDGSLILGSLSKAAWERVTASCGLSWLRPHDLRRTFFTRCRRAGVSLEVAMWLSDHRDVKTALECYREVDGQEGREALDRAFNSRNPR